MARSKIILPVYDRHSLYLSRKESINIMDLETELARSRKQKFQAKIKSDEYGYYLSVTHNGYQWNSVQLNPDEMEVVISVLQEKIDELRQQEGEKND